MAQDSLRVTTTSMGAIKMNTPLSELKSILTIPEKLDSSDYQLYFTTAYKGCTIKVEVYDFWEENKPLKKAVFSMYTEDKLFYTPSGIRYGADKFDVIKKLDGYFLEILPDWRYQEGKDKRYSIVHLIDGDNGTMLAMYFFENKLYAIMVSAFDGC